MVFFYIRNLSVMSMYLFCKRNKFSGGTSSPSGAGSLLLGRLTGPGPALEKFRPQGEQGGRFFPFYRQCVLTCWVTNHNHVAEPSAQLPSPESCMAGLGLCCLSVTHNIFSQACGNVRVVTLCKPNSSDLKRSSEQVAALHVDLIPFELGAHKLDATAPSPRAQVEMLLHNPDEISVSKVTCTNRS